MLCSMRMVIPKRYPPNEYVDGKAGLDSAHRAAYALAFGPAPTIWCVHHVNRLKYDNRPENLIAMPDSLRDWIQRNDVYYAASVGKGIITKRLLEHILLKYLLGLVTISRCTFPLYLPKVLSDDARVLLRATTAQELTALAVAGRVAEEVFRQTEARECGVATCHMWSIKAAKDAAQTYAASCNPPDAA